MDKILGLNYYGKARKCKLPKIKNAMRYGTTTHRQIDHFCKKGDNGKRKTKATRQLLVYSIQKIGLILKQSEVRIKDNDYYISTDLDCIANNKNSGKITIIEWKTGNEIVFKKGINIENGLLKDKVKDSPHTRAMIQLLMGEYIIYHQYTYK